MDRKTFSKSAPATGRRVSKDTTKKLTTIREISCWIDKGDLNQKNKKSSRNVGMLTENVTEQRLLHTRQLELGRERYKFLASHSYEKHKFVERQNRKDKSMKKMMLNARRIIETTHSKPESSRRAITVRIPQMEEIKDPNVVDADEKVESIQKTESRPVSRVASRPASKVSKASEEKPKQTGKSVSKTVHFPKPMQTGKRPNISGKNVYINLSNTSLEVRKPSESVKQDDKLPALGGPQKKAIAYSSRIGSAVSQKSVKSNGNDKRVSETTASVDKNTSTQKEAPEKAMALWRLKSHERKIPKFGQKFNSSVGDPRYVALTNTLVQCDDVGKPVVSVEDIIAKKDILRGESKCERNSREKQLHARFIAYILNQELSFR